MLAAYVLSLNRTTQRRLAVDCSDQSYGFPLQAQMEELWMAARQEDARKEKASPQGLLGKLRKNMKGFQ